MSDFLKHECGIALIRLLKPLQYYEQKYGTPLYGFHKLFLLMEKQHNRGQDGAGIGCVKIDMPPGHPYMFRDREIKTNSLVRLFSGQQKKYDKLMKKGKIIPEYAPSVKEHFDFGGELLFGHLRYGTSGDYDRAACHPFLRRSNWPTKNLLVAGNFNMTNTNELNETLINRGQHPIFGTDTQTVLEEIGFHLDEAHTAIYHKYRDEGMPGDKIPERISEELDIPEILRAASEPWDGGYTIAGLIGNGDSFVMRDPKGIRPCFYFQNDEVIAVASERVPLMTVFDLPMEEVQELEPGKALIIRKSGEHSLVRFTEEQTKIPCSFERIYFSRGNDPDIYQERKALGGALVPQVVKAIDNDLDHAVISYVPNTAEVAYYGLMEHLRLHRRLEVKQEILKALENGGVSEDFLDQVIMRNWPRGEKIAHKDIKLRTFISQEKGRNQLVSHVYDISYGVVNPEDNLVVIDDSIVRGTTLRNSILKILTRTNPRKIIIASTAPQIRYPDCYGIDMAEIGKFIAFQAAVELTRRRGNADLLREVYEGCCRQIDKPNEEKENLVRHIYEQFTDEEIAAEVSALVYPKDIEWDGEIEIIFQTIENLHKAIPVHHGDWYFTGNYPTPGGYGVLNQAYIHYFENRVGRAYDVPKLVKSS